MATSKECEREQRFVATLAASLFRPEEVAAVPVLKHSFPTLPPTLQSYFLQSHSGAPQQPQTRTNLRI